LANRPLRVVGIDFREVLLEGVELGFLRGHELLQGRQVALLGKHGLIVFGDLMRKVALTLDTNGQTSRQLANAQATQIALTHLFLFLSEPLLNFAVFIAGILQLVLDSLQALLK